MSSAQSEELYSSIYWMIMVTGVVEIAIVLSLLLSLFLISGVSTLIYTTYLPSSPPYTWIVDGLC